MPDILTVAIGPEEIRARTERLPGLLDYFAQNMYPGTIQIEDDAVSGRASIRELIRFGRGRSELDYALYHDRYQRTPDGWKFTERVYEIRYLDTGLLTRHREQGCGGRTTATTTR